MMKLYSTATTFLLFSLHHHHHHHHHISIVFLHHHHHRHHHISIVFPPPPLYIFRLANLLADFRQLDHIQRRQYLQEWKLQPKVKVVFYESEADNSAKKIAQLVLAVQYRHKKRCTNCQDHEEIKPLLKQKLKEQLQRTRQTERNKESRTLGLEAIGKLCRHGRMIYYSS